MDTFFFFFIKFLFIFSNPKTLKDMEQQVLTGNRES